MALEQGDGVPLSRDVDLSGLVGTYREGIGAATSPRAARVMTVIALAVAVLALGGAVVAVISRGLPGLLQWLGDAAFVLLVSLGGWIPALRPPMTRLDAAALTARTGMLTTRTVPWDDVLAINGQGRWDVHSRAVLADGSHLSLPGLPAEVVQRLADAVAQARPEVPAPQEAERPQGPAAVPQRRGRPVLPADDEGMEGPFRRGPRRT